MSCTMSTTCAPSIGVAETVMNPKMLQTPPSQDHHREEGGSDARDEPSERGSDGCDNRLRFESFIAFTFVNFIMIGVMIGVMIGLMLRLQCRLAIRK